MGVAYFLQTQEFIGSIEQTEIIAGYYCIILNEETVIDEWLFLIFVDEQGDSPSLIIVRQFADSNIYRRRLLAGYHFAGVHLLIAQPQLRTVFCMQKPRSYSPNEGGSKYKQYA